MLLSRIASPDDVKALDRTELPALCAELRRALLASSSAIGGHVGSNLAVIELTVALHRVFSSPRDKLVFDVSHQTYAHKALTGRARAFTDPAHYGEVSGFSNPLESEHDLFAVGHTSTSVGLACGLAKARDLAGDVYDVVAVIGDGALSGGLAFEGLDNAAELGSGLIVIINDNDHSIAENHGGLYGNLARLRATGGAAQDNFFRALGLDYRYLAEGNDVLALVDALEGLRGADHPVVLHVRTKKGRGFEPAERDPESWHHVGPFDLAGTAAPDLRSTAAGNAAGSTAPASYADITGTMLIDRMRRDRGVVAISAATPYIMGFTPTRRREAGAQFVDVGIAEEHAITYATALAAGGAKPVVGIYGTFLQRAYDELWHDLCLNGAPATILVFGSSIFGTTDQTHLGFFDLSMLGDMPGLRVLAPVCVEEYRAMVAWSIDQRERPVAIRVPAAGVVSRPDLTPPAGATFDVPAYQEVRAGGDVAILALGDLFEMGERLADELERRAGLHATLANPRFASELDCPYLSGLADRHRLVVTVEDGVLEGGWGEKVARFLGPVDIRVRCFGIHAGFPDRYDAEKLLESNGMTVDAMADEVFRLLS